MIFPAFGSLENIPATRKVSSIIRTTFWEGYLSHQHLTNTAKIHEFSGVPKLLRCTKQLWSRCDTWSTFHHSTFAQLNTWSLMENWAFPGSNRGKALPKHWEQSCKCLFSAQIAIFCGWLFVLLVVYSSNDSNIDFKMSKGGTMVSQHVR